MLNSNRLAPFYNRPVAVGFNPLYAGPVIVPSDFLGMHFHRYPNGTTPAPTGLAYGSVRTHDGGLAWYKINTADGVYDWTALDNAVAKHRAAGKTILFTIYGTPQFALLRPAEAGVTDGYGSPGGAGAAIPYFVNKFVVALLTRYNTGGQHGIGKIEYWNEPSFTGVIAPGKFFWGSGSELVAMSKAANDAKVVDSSVEWLSPGFSGGLGNMVTWLDASGGGVMGKDIVTGVCWHNYGATALPPSSVMFGDNGASAVDEILNRRGMVGIKKYVTEYGIDAAPGDIINAFLALPANLRYARVAGVLLGGAFAGLSGYYLYAYDNTNFLCGQLMTDVEGAVRAVQDVGNKVAGQTISEMGYLNGSSLTCKINGVRTIFQ